MPMPDASRKTSRSTNISFKGWKKILVQVKDQVTQDNVSIISAGVAFYAFMALFPAIAALISIYGLVMDPKNIQDQLAQLYQIMPQQAYQILQDQVKNLVQTSDSALGWSTAVGIILSIWSANKGTKSLFTGVEIAYDTPNKRGFIQQNSLTLLFTLGAIGLILIAMALLVVFPSLVGTIGLPEAIEKFVSWARWPLVALLVVWFLGMIYRRAPDRPRITFKGVLPGAILATVLWLTACWAFSFYVRNFGNYGEVYGSISAVVVMLLWLFITSFIIIFGAELNSEIEKYRITRKDL